MSAVASWRERRRLRRLERARLCLADEEHELHVWGFAYTPSRTAAQERRIERARVYLERLEGARTPRAKDARARAHYREQGPHPGEDDYDATYGRGR